MGTPKLSPSKTPAPVNLSQSFLTRLLDKPEAIAAFPALKEHVQAKKRLERGCGGCGSVKLGRDAHERLLNLILNMNSEQRDTLKRIMGIAGRKLVFSRQQSSLNLATEIEL